MPSPAPSALEPQTPLGDYRIVRILGSGNMGAVYEGVHALLGKRVAIKVMHDELAQRADLVERFLREGRAAVAIRHPNVVQVTHVGFHQGLPYLVMDFLEGSDLRAALTERGRFPATEACDLLLPVIAGVAAAHEAGVTHRDLKPENVFLVRAGRRERVTAIPTVVDFGIAKLDDGHKTTTQTILGSPAYMSPEQCNGRTGPQSDQWALGVMLYELCCGALPFSADTQMALMFSICFHPPRPAAELGGRLPAALEAVILRALQKEPEARFPSVRALGAALLPLCGAVLRERYEHEFADAEPHAPPVASHPTDGPTQLAPRMDPVALGLSFAAPQDERTARPLMITQVAASRPGETPPPEPPPARPTDTLTPASRETSPPQARSRRLVLAGAGVAASAVVLVLVLVLRPGGPPRGPTAAPVSAPPKERPAAVALPVDEQASATTPETKTKPETKTNANPDAPATSATPPAKAEPTTTTAKATVTPTKPVAAPRSDRRPGKPVVSKPAAPAGRDQKPAQPKAFFPDD